MIKRLFLLCVLCLASCVVGLGAKAQANNIDVSSASLTDVNFSQGTVKVQFNISWENSWRTDTNYDAAWVFVKYSTDSGTTWSHATFKADDTNPLDDSPSLGWSKGTGTDLSIVVPTDKKGAFLQRSSNDVGNVSTSSVQFVWNYGGLGGDALSGTATARVKVFAVEMVYIPTGAFYLGDGNGSNQSPGAFYQTANTKVLIDATLKNNIKCGNTFYDDSQLESTGIGIQGGGGLDTDNEGSVDNVSFPTGYSAFYIMKYEISQGQYADFLNTLTSSHASTYYPNYNGNYRYTISGTYPNYSASRPDRACNYLSWPDLYAYADWAGLRPMTELEFEKAARGTASTVTVGEYAWGSTSITEALAISGTSEGGTETITTLGANCTYYANAYTGGDATGQDDTTPYPYTRGPLRCGIFATGSSTRVTSGAGYYGAMELSGNLWERPVTVGNTEGRAFTGAHGDGNLSTTPSNWPSSSTVTGSGLRGGSWYYAATVARVSARSNAAYPGTLRRNNDGGRCARTSP